MEKPAQLYSLHMHNYTKIFRQFDGNMPISYTRVYGRGFYFKEMGKVDQLNTLTAEYTIRNDEYREYSIAEM